MRFAGIAAGSARRTWISAAGECLARVIRMRQRCFAYSFEVHPKPDRWDAYLGYAKSLKPELERIDGFIENMRYRSLTREGWLLSLSSWRDESRWCAGARRVSIIRCKGWGAPRYSSTITCAWVS